MTRWTLGDIASCLGTTLGDEEADTEVTAVSTDSRTLERGSLFVPLVGEKFDGHNYAEMAVGQRGARAVVWSREEVPDFLENVAIFRVKDTLLAYQALGLYWKEKCGVRVVGITGSVGKTTTKEFLAHFLGPHFCVHKSRANYNNDIGVPKTLLELRPEHEVAIVEMGMRGRGEIARLVQAARPEVGIITGIGTSHLELLGSREEIALAKGELVEGLGPSGRAILPRADEFFELLQSLSAVPVEQYSAVPDFKDALCPDRILGEDAESITFEFEGDSYRMPVPGHHHLHDLFAVLAAGRALGLPVKTMLQDLPTLSNPDGRAQWIDLRGARVFLDAYNSAPESLRASLRVLKACEGRRLAVLGDMLELGESGQLAHQEIGASLKDFGVELLFCFGPLSQGMADAALAQGVDSRWFEDKGELTAALSSELRRGDFVLVKASRGMALETVVDAMKERVG